MYKIYARIKGILHRLHMTWNGIRMLQKFIIVCITFLIIPILTVSTVLFSITLPLAQNEGRDSLVSMVNQLNENIQYRISGYQNILAQLAFDSRLSSELTQEYENLPDAVFSLQDINSLVKRVNTYFPMRRICIYQNNSTLPEDLGSVFKFERAYKEPWYKSMENSPKKNFYWYFDVSTPGDPLIYVSTWLTDYMENKNYGIIKLEVPCRIVFEQLSNPLQDKQGWIMLLDQNRRVLSDSRNLGIGSIAEENTYLDTVYKNENGWIFTKINGMQNLVVYQTNNLGWKLVSVVSQEMLWQKIKLLKNVAICISALCIVLTLLVFIGFGSSLTIRLKGLLKSMQEVRKGNFGKQVCVRSDDELAAVENEFNMMSSKLDTMLKDLADARSWAEQEELRLLQAQINPHFLYNTLALVKYMAMDIGAEDICSVIDAVSRFFRLALNRGSDILTIGDELEHVRAYLQIQQLRYPGRVSVKYEIDNNILDCKVIKMTLQPIVENALTHAFVKTSGYGCITIEAAQMDEDIVLKVIDDGCGMAPNLIDELLNKPYRSEEQRGFGLRNVHERLKMYYGGGYGLEITSTINSGTSVAVRIPFSYVENKEYNQVDYRRSQDDKSVDC